MLELCDVKPKFVIDTSTPEALERDFYAWLKVIIEIWELLRLLYPIELGLKSKNFIFRNFLKNYPIMGNFLKNKH